ncbi:MAG TPA: SH3 domain-containing protein [Roseiflexaceae bacterium]|nr:SH3 domain-containing protein [Roseiflexaceae bacterium]HMP43266.1 SH3 domain-containing protein [Roseiflexaceae bacterium]
MTPTSITDLITIGWSSLILLAFSMLLLEAERLWVARLRRHDQSLPGSVYAVDLAVIVSLLLAVGGLVYFAVYGLVLQIEPIMAPLNVAAAQVVPILLLIVIGLLLITWMRYINRTPPATLPRSSTMTSATGGSAFVSNTTEQTLIRAGALQIDPAYSDENVLPSMRKRQKYTAEPLPESFLDMRNPPATRRRRSWPAQLLIFLVGSVMIVAVIASGATVATLTRVVETLPGLLQASSDPLIATPVVSPPTSVPAQPAASLIEQRVVVDRLNLRAEPGSSAVILLQLRRDDTVLLLGEQREIDGIVWVQVRYNTTDGWVSQVFLE